MYIQDAYASTRVTTNGRGGSCQNVRGTAPLSLTTGKITSA